MYAAMLLVYAHKILSQCDVYFLNGGHFGKISSFGSPVNMIKLRAFIFGTVMRLYWDYPLGKKLYIYQ